MMKLQVHKIATLAGHQDCVYTLEKGTTTHTFFSADGNGAVAQWDLRYPDVGDLIIKVPRSIYALCNLSEKNQLIVGQNFEGLHWIDLENKKEIKSLKLNSTAIFDLKVWEDKLFVACGDGVVVVIDLNEMTTRKHIKTSNKSARTISINPVEGVFAVGNSDNLIQVFDLQTFELRYTIPAHTNSVFSVQYSPDGRFLLSGSRDAHLKIWDVKNQYQLSASIVAHLFAINHIIFSPDTTYFATASMDKSVKIWDYETFTLRKVVDKARHAGHATSVNKLLWTSYQNYLVSGGDDRLLSVWEMENLQEVQK